MRCIRRRRTALGAGFALLGVLCAACSPDGGGVKASLAIGGAGRASAGPAAAAIDTESLSQALATAGINLPLATDVYGAVVRQGAGGLDYDEYDAGGGAYAVDFWPASSIKVLATVGALEYLGQLGFDGTATISYPDGTAWSGRDLIQAAIADSSNDAYDRLVELAGVDWLNTRFLTPQNGFPDTVIQKSYVDPGTVSSPPLTVTDGRHSVSLPARTSSADYGVAAGGNRSDLFEMTDSVRRVVLDGSLPPGERFPLATDDLSAIREALFQADGFVVDAAATVLGSGVQVYDKPGDVIGDDCVDVAYIAASARATTSYLLGIATPDDGDGCDVLSTIAAGTLRFLAGRV